MDDYVSGEGLSEEEVDAYMVQEVIPDDPILFEEAVKHEKWRKAMDSEISSIENNQTWELMDLPIGAKTIGVKWIYKTKLNERGEIDKHKARLVAKGYSQKQGIDFTEVFAPVARMDTVRMIVALAACRGWDIFQLDVKFAFLHGILSEDVYIEQPKGYVKKGEDHKVYKLHKALYGLKQAPRAWFSRIESQFISEGFQKCPTEQTLFIKRHGGKILIVSIYVDDLIYTGDDKDLMIEFKTSMMQTFDMTDLGKMKYFLGIEVLQKPEGIFLCQRKYATDVLKKFAMYESKPVKIPIVPGFKIHKDEDGTAVADTYYKQMVGSLIYLTATRPDIMFNVSLISRYMSRPTELHLQAAKRIFRYLKGTTGCEIFYKKGGDEDLFAFTDSDYAGDEADSRSTSGYVFLLSSGAVSWMSKKQPIVTLSTTEAEFVAAAACASQVVWMRQVLKNLSHNQESSTTIMCDNSSTIKFSKNPVLHGRCKHIRVRFHFSRDLVRDGEIELVHCGTQEQVADLMTKALKIDTFEKHRKKIGMVDISELN
ncbi:retrovirus-related Pol polyprotein from transposon TNT 1-94 [Dorcoceras hygrometricum]|uniref:Retrovirus-related Pol polyprotein from transposon TNT 1-94 n=1 Tax=Dorcoceras hygrometricum TaxID=472368 RepID=A0A2Z7BY65_9LAMI|nr:retrovirus-related Pol polyprotein from transposon TNT 1-94 [Dorcoceras hygrometricum]